MYRYGFELEGFYRSPETGLITVPPVMYPTDGFPGLVEFRTDGHAILEDAFGKLLLKMCMTGYADFTCTEAYHTFTPQEKRLIRKRPNFQKPEADIQNIYDKNPKALGNKTIASLQINISNLVSASYTDKDRVFHPDQFTLLDVPRIVKALDTSFKDEIKEAGRQRGEYCIKGERLEYRSLPNTVMPSTFENIKDFLGRIKNAIED